MLLFAPLEMPVWVWSSRDLMLAQSACSGTSWAAWTAAPPMWHFRKAKCKSCGHSNTEGKGDQSYLLVSLQVLLIKLLESNRKTVLTGRTLRAVKGVQCTCVELNHPRTTCLQIHSFVICKMWGENSSSILCAWREFTPYPWAAVY